jgi:hypothetical protein
MTAGQVYYGHILDAPVLATKPCGERWLNSSIKRGSAAQH